MPDSEQLYTVTAFSNDHEYKIRQGVVYVVTDMTEEQKDALVAREQQQNPSFWLKVEVQG
ncbi:hypothetical protein ACFO9E_18340 [Streptomyces maoxianensis]|uniref:Uncharacterized protein n=1 Tax=Streptomyces maoxianensis TaxID=1459942 RepID=A0ABV9GAW6_9ACTN